MGARPYRYLKNYRPDPGCLIEIGSERGEGSTTYLARYAHDHGLRFYTVDIDPQAYSRASAITPGARLGSGSVFLARIRKPISVAYLDGFDWIPDEPKPWIKRQRARYRRLGLELDNSTCQAEHLDEARLVEAKAAARCLVICDDTYHEDDGRWTGKGGLVVPYLEQHGFTVIENAQPQGRSLGYAILSRG